MSGKNKTIGSKIPMRVRIMGLVLAIVIVIQGTVSAIFMLYERDAVRSSFDQAIERRLDAVIEELTDTPETWEIERLATMALREAGFLYFEDVQIAVFDSENKFVNGSTDSFTEAAFESFDGLVARAQESVSMVSASFSSGVDGEVRPYRVACKSFDVGERSYSVCFYTSQEYLSRNLRDMSLMLLVALPISVIAVGIASWYIAGIAVRPITGMQDFAAQLDPSTLDDEVTIDDSASPEMQELKRELTDALARVKAGYASHSRFLANMSHELKTPVSVVLAEAQAYMSTNHPDDATKSFVTSTADEMRRLGKMIESFLMLSRIREGKMAIHPSSYSANELLVDVMAACAGYAAQYGVSIHPTLYEGEDDEDLTLHCNADLLVTAIGNLIRNAIRFSVDGSPVDIRVERRGEHIVYTVRDYGPGVPEALMPTIFDPYVQAKTEMVSGRGTGLGLQIAQGIVEIHGGLIRVQNLERGCVFTIRLPQLGKPGIDAEYEE